MPSTQTAPTIEQVELKPSQLVPHKKNIRRDVGDVSDLADSVRAKGVLQPLVVVPNGKPDKYVIIAGHRRHAAAKAAKVATVPCVIRHDLTDEKDQIAVMMVENGQRTDLTAVEEAKGVQTLLDLGDTQKRIAERTGMSAAKIRNRAKVAKLPDELCNKLNEHAVTLDDAVFIADHTDTNELEYLERALGTNNWAAAKETVIRRDKERRAKEKLSREIAAAGYREVAAHELRAATSELLDKLGLDEGSAIQSVFEWPPTESGPASAAVLDDKSNAFVFTGWDGFARLYVFTRDEDEPPVEAGSSATAGDSGNTPEDRGPSPRDPVQPSPEAFAAQRRREALADATSARHKFIQDVIVGGKLEHARLAGQTAGCSIDYCEISWSSLLDFVPVDDPHPDSPQQFGQVDEDRGAAVQHWIDTQVNPYVLLLALSWVFLEQADRALAETKSAQMFDLEELQQADRYIKLLEVCGHTFSDAELEVVHDIREAISEELDAAEPDGGAEDSGE